MKQLITLLLLCESGVALGQPEMEWIKYYSAEQRHFSFNNVIQTQDGNWLASGDQEIVKISMDGSTLWERPLPCRWTALQSLEEMDDGVLAYLTTERPNYQVHLDPEGNLLDSVRYYFCDGPPEWCTGSGTCVLTVSPASRGRVLRAIFCDYQCVYGGCYGRYTAQFDRYGRRSSVNWPYPLATESLIADTNYRLYVEHLVDGMTVLSCFDTLQSMLWRQEFAVSGQLTHRLLMIKDTLLYFAADHVLNSRVSPFVAAISTAGNLIFANAYEFPESRSIRHLTLSSDGAVIGCGMAHSGVTDSMRIMLFRLSSTGELQWDTIYETPESAGGYAVAVNARGQIAVAGAANRNGSFYRSSFVMMTDYDPLFPIVAELHPIVSGPPLWGYRITIDQGQLSALTVRQLCPGTTARLGGMAASRFTIQLSDSNIFFNANEPVGVSQIDTIYLEHPTCSGTINWASGLISGSGAGPYSPPQAIEISSWAVDTTSTSVRYHFTVNDEQNIAVWTLSRRCGDVGFTAVASALSQGLPGPRDYWLIDSLGGVNNSYMLSHRDVYGWVSPHPETTSNSQGPQWHIRFFRATGTKEGNVIELVAESVPRIQLLFVWRSQNGGPYVLCCTQEPDPSAHLASIRLVDTDVIQGNLYRYYPEYTECNGRIVQRLDLADSATAIVTNPAEIPLAYRLSAYPNPFNPSTNLEFAHSRRERVTISVYDLLGRHVEKVYDDIVDPGVATIRFDAHHLSDGIYFAVADFASGDTQITKLVLLK